jgi:malonyl-CoA/methylmalonyl-CoA synthetase
VTVSANFFSELRSHWTDGEKIALETGSGKRLSYDEIVKISSRFANALTASGVEPGDRVAVQVEKSPEALCLYLACLRAGAVFLPLNSAYTEAELDYFLRDSEPSVFVCRPETGKASAKLCKKTDVANCFTLGQNGEGSLVTLAAAQSDAFEDVLRATSDLAAILYTSGTTGRSKGAMLTHGNLSSNAHRSSRHGALRAATCCCTPCRSSTPMACSWQATSRFCLAQAWSFCRSSIPAKY